MSRKPSEAVRRWTPRHCPRSHSACRDQVQVGFEYLKAGAADDAAESRQVEPLRLVPVGRRWYLVAFDLDRFDWRMFRLDRMTAPKPTSRSFRPRRLPGDDPAAFVREGLSRSRTDDEVIALVALDADIVREKVGRWATVTETDRGTQVTMRYSLSWVMLALGELDADYEFVAIPDSMFANCGYQRAGPASSVPGRQRLTGGDLPGCPRCSSRTHIRAGRT